MKKKISKTEFFVWSVIAVGAAWYSSEDLLITSTAGGGMLAWALAHNQKHAPWVFFFALYAGMTLVLGSLVASAAEGLQRGLVLSAIIVLAPCAIASFTNAAEQESERIRGRAHQKNKRQVS